ncbi:sigma-54-dependent transcriptional regulator [Desulforhabdus amnigena]|jgi:DNA-binding NtrC family response regulator|uniref:Sigma-54-dependent Fis family transcriptional regulator n=1 Tax=Desulforhabdus amnigena TaxID=40218 RepID=A0A9W6FRF7_9BACT|nr:sigma-54 dependent transcriptional regulator [Desulforhabdus amnigena]NLJ27749.1 sigma-54-dependent Fis family transcriptional regulator [Deltaproteobacteria bacterium]GLI32959.1 sigma-54-dependent Fis family transcriptional regulator [Desulforhabdus amnigena]
MRGAKILVAEDEPIARENLEHILRKESYNVVSVENGAAAIKEMEKSEFDLVMTDLRMQPVDGLQVLKRAKELYPNTEVIVITGFATVGSAVEAMQKGAYYYVPKPYKIDEVRIIVRQALEKRSLRQEVSELRERVKCQRDTPLLIGSSPQMEALKKTIEQVAPADCSVLILGETGTGKELVAKTIHSQSLRADRRFLAVNCGAFSEELLANELFGHEKEAFTGARGIKKGLLEAANGGTIFLDEIGDMPLSMQVKLLRVLQEKAFIRVGGTDEIPVDIRVLAATNKDLKREVEHGNFRQDLYYRLNVITLHVPRLADRKDDILLLSLHFLRKICHAQGKHIEAISDEVMDVLLSYEFPGNVRELENIMERAVTLSNKKTIEIEHLPADLRQLALQVQRPDTGFVTLEENERQYISRVLEKVDYNKTKAAEILGIDRVSLWRKLKRHHMD